MILFFYFWVMVLITVWWFRTNLLSPKIIYSISKHLKLKNLILIVNFNSLLNFIFKKCQVQKKFKFSSSVGSPARQDVGAFTNAEGENSFRVSSGTLSSASALTTTTTEQELHGRNERKHGWNHWQSARLAVLKNPSRTIVVVIKKFSFYKLQCRQERVGNWKKPSQSVLGGGADDGAMSSVHFVVHPLPGTDDQLNDRWEHVGAMGWIY